MQNFKEYVNSLERKLAPEQRKCVFVCIGTSKIVWDSIGPLVGTILKNNIGNNMVIGDIENNICNRNDIVRYYSKLRKKYVIAIDSAISSKGCDGEIFVNNMPIIMGKGINQNKGVIGDISIKASISNLYNVDIKYVERISCLIAKGICYWYRKFGYE